MFNWKRVKKMHWDQKARSSTATKNRCRMLVAWGRHYVCSFSTTLLRMSSGNKRNPNPQWCYHDYSITSFMWHNIFAQIWRTTLTNLIAQIPGKTIFLMKWSKRWKLAGARMKTKQFQTRLRPPTWIQNSATIQTRLLHAHSSLVYICTYRRILTTHKPSKLNKNFVVKKKIKKLKTPVMVRTPMKVFGRQ